MDTGKSDPVSKAWVAGHEFDEQQLKQLRAQCIVFLAFKNGLNPKKPHLEIARDVVEQKGKEQVVEVPSSLERPDHSSMAHPSSSDCKTSEEPDENISQPAVAAEDGNNTKCLAMLKL